MSLAPQSKLSDQSLVPLESFLFHKFTEQLSSANPLIDQIKLIREQQDMLKQLKRVIKTNSDKQNSSKASPPIRRKGTAPQYPLKEHPNPHNSVVSVQCALQQVASRCSDGCIQALRQMYDTCQKHLNSAHQADYYKGLYQKLILQNSELRNKLSLLQYKTTQLQALLNNSTNQAELKDLRRQRSMVQQISRQLGVKQIKLSKMETSIHAKQGFLKNYQQRLQNQESELGKLRISLQRQRCSLDEGWIKLVEQVDEHGDFRSDIREMYLDSVMAQRQRLDEEQVQIRKKHDKIDKLIQRLEGHDQIYL